MASNRHSRTSFKKYKPHQTLSALQRRNAEIIGFSDGYHEACRQALKIVNDSSNIREARRRIDRLFVLAEVGK